MHCLEEMEPEVNNTFTLSRLRKPYRGKVLLEGKDIRRYSDKELFRNFLGVLPQNPQSLFVKKSVELELFEMVGGVKEKKDEEYQLAMDKKDAVEGIIKVTHLEELLHRHPYDLSGESKRGLPWLRFCYCGQSFC